MNHLEEPKWAQATLTEEAYRHYLSHLLDGDAAVCRKMVDEILEKKHSVHDLYEDVFRRSLYEVGTLWECDRISVADEHLATAMTESLMTRTYPYLFQLPRCGHTAVVSCVTNEFHQIGGKMVADTFEMFGWDSYFLGADTPIDELVKLVEKKQPDVIALSISIYSCLPTLRKTIQALRKRFAAPEIWVGGQAFRWGGKEQMADLPKVYLLESLSALQARLSQWSSKR